MHINASSLYNTFRYTSQPSNRNHSLEEQNMSNSTPSTNGSCPHTGGNLPANTIPNNSTLDYCATAATNETTPRWMHCCAPYPVQLADGCWEWCQLPPQYFTSGATNVDVSTAFTNCLLGLGDVSNEGILCNVPSVKSAATITSGGQGLALTVSLAICTWHLLF